jgi:hypothetical protein
MFVWLLFFGKALVKQHLITTYFFKYVFYELLAASSSHLVQYSLATGRSVNCTRHFDQQDFLRHLSTSKVKQTTTSTLLVIASSKLR